MSNMLEQAIVDAAALREAALKNAEQAIIEKYAPQIKEAVEAMLETEDLNENHCRAGDRVKHEGVVVEVVYEEDDDGMVTVKEMGGKPYMVRREEIQQLSEEDLLKEEEMGMDAGATGGGEIEAPFAGNPSMSADQSVEFSLDIEDLGDGMISIDLDALVTTLPLNLVQINWETLIIFCLILTTQRTQKMMTWTFNYKNYLTFLGKMRFLRKKLL